LKDLGDKISGDKKKQVEDAIAAVREAIESQRHRRDEADLRRLAEQVPGSQRRPLQAQASAQAGPRRPDRNPGPEAQPQAALNKGAGRAARATWSTRSSKSSTKTRRNNKQFVGCSS
jgi:hypothetical protein